MAYLRTGREMEMMHLELTSVLNEVIEAHIHSDVTLQNDVIQAPFISPVTRLRLNAHWAICWSMPPATATAGSVSAAAVMSISPGSVEDDGNGIDEADIPDLFQPFVQGEKHAVIKVRAGAGNSAPDCGCA